MKTGTKLLLGVGAAIGLGYGIRSMRRANFRKIWRDSWADTGNRYGPGAYEWLTLNGRYGVKLITEAETKANYHLNTNTDLTPVVAPGDAWYFKCYSEPLAGDPRHHITWVDAAGGQVNLYTSVISAAGIYGTIAVAPANAVKWRWHIDCPPFSSVFSTGMTWQKAPVVDNREFVSRLYKLVLKRECEWNLATVPAVVSESVTGLWATGTGVSIRQTLAVSFTTGNEAQRNGLGVYATPPQTPLDALEEVYGVK